MYEVYSQQRPGRPRWTWGASAIVLLLTIALAAAVVQHKSHSLAASLAAPQNFPRGQLRCAVPAGWKLLPTEDLSPGAALTALETDERGRARRLIVFRDRPRPLGMPMSQGINALKQFVPSASPDDDPRQLDVEAGQIGPLPACTIIGVRSLGRVSVTVLSRFAIAPAGQTVGVILVVPGPESLRDRKLFDEFSKTIELNDVRPAKDGAAALREAGVVWEPPTEVRVFPDTTPSSGCVHLIGGTEDHPWYLTIARVPLLADRNPSALVRDFCLAAIDQPQLPEEVHTDSLGTRATARIRFSQDSGGQKPLLVLCVQIDPQTALMMIGRSDGENDDDLSHSARIIAERATVAPFSERMNLEKAQAAGRAWLKDLASRGLKSFWGDSRSKHVEFSIRFSSQTLGTETRVLKSERRGEELWWELRSSARFDRLIRNVDVWKLQDDGRKSEYVSILSESDHERRYEETWSAGGAIRRELTMPEADPKTTTLDSDPLFVTEPLMIQAAAGLAGAKTGAVFSSTETFTPDLSYWTLIPLGEQPLPGESNKTSQATLIQHDFDPRPITLYFDKNNELEAISFMDGRYQIRTRQPAKGGTAE